MLKFNKTLCFIIFQASDNEEVCEIMSKVKINEEDEDSKDNSSSDSSSG